MKIKKLHYISGILISVFIGAHLFNHFMSVFGVDKHIELMNSLRVLYRNMIIETILLIAVSVQVISGIKLFKAKRKTVATFYEKLQIWSGLYLAFFMIMHVGAVMVGRYVLNLDTNIYFGAAGLNTFPLNLLFVPYYGLAIMSFFGHISAIHGQKMKKTIFGMTPEQQSKLILVKGLIVTVIIFYGLTNGFTGISIPEDYNIMIGK